MTEKEKAIEDETIELPTGPAEKKKPHRGRIVVITVAALALLAAGGIAWRTHEDRLMAEARADCAAESERLRVATTAYDALLNGKAASMAKTDVKSVKDAKTLDVLSKAMKASTPKTVSCKADSRPGVQDATKGVTANASWYKAHTKSLNGLVNAVETSKLDKTVDDANALYKETDGRVADDKTIAQSLMEADHQKRPRLRREARPWPSSGSPHRQAVIPATVHTEWRLARGIFLGLRRHQEATGLIEGREGGRRIEGGEGEGRRGGEGQGRTGGRGCPRGRRRRGSHGPRPVQATPATPATVIPATRPHRVAARPGHLPRAPPEAPTTVGKKITATNTTASRVSLFMFNGFKTG